MEDGVKVIEALTQWQEIGREREVCGRKGVEKRRAAEKWTGKRHRRDEWSETPKMEVKGDGRKLRWQRRGEGRGGVCRGELPAADGSQSQ